MLCRKVGQLHADPRELNELYYRAAKTADELGDNQKALGYYKAAYDIDSTYLPTLVGRADLLFKMQDWDNAGKIYQTILVQHRDGQDEAEVVRIYNRLGQVRQNLGERKKALNMFEKALEIDPTHRETLLAVIDLQTAQGDWEAVIHAKRGADADAPTRRRRSSSSSEIGGIYYEKLQNPQKAIGRVPRGARARARRPPAAAEGPRPLHRDQAVEEGRRDHRAVRRRSRPTRSARARTSTPPATICRDELKSLDEAVDYFNQRARQLLRRTRASCASRCCRARSSRSRRSTRS